MRILIVSDAWRPQVNGVVRTLEALIRELEKTGHRVDTIVPDQFRSVPCPTYPEIRLAFARHRRIDELIATAAPDAIHIATEGPLGVAARRWCLRRGRPFTTAYHTQFPEYVAKRTRLPAAWFWRYIRWFHSPAHAVLVSTPTVARQLNAHGMAQTRHWGRGVDGGLFNPDRRGFKPFEGLKRPIQLYVGRIATEKNIEAFLETHEAGSKVVVGDGPALAELRLRYPDAHFVGALHGEALACAYGSADVFVFPSRTDTFGLVMIEALACGTPVAAYPVPGPLDVLRDGAGSMDADLGRAMRGALACERERCVEVAGSFSWSQSAGQFLAALAPMPLEQAA